MNFYITNGGICNVSGRVCAGIEHYLQRTPTAPETGGVLLGRLIVNSNDVVIDDVTVPNKEDRQTRNFFFRSRQTAQLRIEKAWRESAGTSIYLGEWHTHPEDEPNRSVVDIENWERIYRKARYEQDFLVFVIAGRSVTRLWEMRAGCRLTKLTSNLVQLADEPMSKTKETG